MRLFERGAGQHFEQALLGDTDSSYDDLPNDMLQVIDNAVSRCAQSRFVPSSEVIDLLLDLRSAVVLDAALGTILRELGDPRDGQVRQV